MASSKQASQRGSSISGLSTLVSCVSSWKCFFSSLKSAHLLLARTRNVPNLSLPLSSTVHMGRGVIVHRTPFITASFLKHYFVHFQFCGKVLNTETLGAPMQTYLRRSPHCHQLVSISYINQIEWFLGSKPSWCILLIGFNAPFSGIIPLSVAAPGDLNEQKNSVYRVLPTEQY